MPKYHYEAELRDMQLLRGLLMKLKGDDRSFSQYAKAAGISPSALSRIMSEKDDYSPGPATLRKLNSEKASPREEIDDEVLLTAAGYVPDNMKDPGPEDRNFRFSYLQDLMVRVPSEKNDGTGEDPKKDGELQYMISAKGDGTGELPIENMDGSIFDAESGSYRRFLEYVKRFRDYNIDRVSEGILYTALAKKGIRFSAVNNVELPERKTGGIYIRRVDLHIRPEDGPIRDWLFDYYFRTGNRTGERELYGRIVSICMAGTDPVTKYSFVVGEAELFQRIKGFRNHGDIPFRGELSVILVDLSKMLVLDEFYLAHYIENDRSKEIFLVDPKTQQE